MRDALVVAETDENKYPALSVLRRDYGDEKVESVIKLYLLDLCANVNLKRPLKEVQIDNIARRVISKYYALTIADVHVIFDKALNGDYGEFYESLDVPKVMSWFCDYFNKRCDLAAEMSENTGYYDKGGNITPAHMTKRFNALENKFKKNNK